MSDPLRVGLLHSLTGTMAFSEAPLVDAACLALEQLNAAGGLLGRRLEPVLRDGASNAQQFAQMALELLDGEQVATVFGCWTSLSRKAVLPLFEARDRLLWYPVQYEGLEASPAVIYTGSCPNQQVEPALDWLLAQGRRRIYLLGSDYVFPRIAHKIIRGRLKWQHGTVVGETYVPLGATDFHAIATQIATLQPDAIINTLNGDSNIAFYAAAQAAGLTAERTPIMAVSIAEGELQRIGTAATGHYACWSYFQSLDRPANHQFVAQFQQRYGRDRVTSDPIATAYTQVYLWHQAVTRSQTTATDAVRQALYHQTWESPGGRVHCEPNHHLQKECHIGQIQSDGQFKIVYSSDGPLKPLPWLGIETYDSEAAHIAIEMLGEVSQCEQYSWELEQQSRLLEQTTQQLRHEIEQRRQAEVALTAANAEIIALNQALQVDNQRMQSELDIARRLQEMILPREEELSSIPDLDIAGFMQAAEEVGGDYYDVLHNGNRLITIGIGDVTGHGLESGVLMLMTQTAVRTLRALQETDPVKSLNAINTVLYQNRLRMSSYRNLSLALLDYRDGELQICGQHEEVLIVRAEGTVERIDTLELGYPVGMLADISAFTAQQQVSLAIGDGVVLYTDGITEAESGDRCLYGLERLIQVVEKHWSGTAREIRTAVIGDLRLHIGDRAVYDDITLVVLKRKA